MCVRLFIFYSTSSNITPPEEEEPFLQSDSLLESEEDDIGINVDEGDIELGQALTQPRSQSRTQSRSLSQTQARGQFSPPASVPWRPYPIPKRKRTSTGDTMSTLESGAEIANVLTSISASMSSLSEQPKETELSAFTKYLGMALMALPPEEAEIFMDETLTALVKRRNELRRRNQTK